jgi:hypothetical protein
MKLAIGGIIIFVFVLLYFFAKDTIIRILGKARDGLAIIGAGTIVYWIYIFMLKQH